MTEGDKMKRLSIKTRMTCLFLFYGLMAVWAVSYYSKEVPMLRGESYKLASSSPDNKVYNKKGKPSLSVQTLDDVKVIKVGEFEYTINEKLVNGLHEYTVNYPDGLSYIVKEQDSMGNMATYHMDGSLYLLEDRTKVKDTQNINELEANDYDAQSIVQVAYDKNYEKRGNWLAFIGGFILLNSAMLVFYSRQIQMKLFNISQSRKIAKPEPSDFYFTATKTGCLFAASAALIMMISAL